MPKFDEAAIVKYQPPRGDTSSPSPYRWPTGPRRPREASVRDIERRARAFAEAHAQATAEADALSAADPKVKHYQAFDRAFDARRHEWEGEG